MKKICRICNKEFETKAWNREVCYEDHYKICKYCNKEFKLDPKDKGSKQILRDYCYDSTCKNIHLKETYKESMLSSYGVTSTWQLDKTKKSIKKTLLDVYGIDSPMKSKEIQNKSKETLKKNYNVTSISQLESSKSSVRNKYGVDYAFQSKEIQNKVRENLFNNYGVVNVYQLESTKQSIKNTNLKKFGVDSPMKLERIRNKCKETCIKKYNVPYTFMLGTYKTISNINKRFSELLNKNGLSNSFEFNIDKFNYDIKLNDSNLLIEINPTYTHNSTNKLKFNNKFVNPKNKNYHYNKSKTALDNDYICIHKFDWQSNEEILILIKNINNYKIEQHKPRLHWYNIRTKEHILDNNFDKNEMIKNGFVEIYDDGCDFIKIN